MLQNIQRDRETSTSFEAHASLKSESPWKLHKSLDHKFEDMFYLNACVFGRF